MSHQSSATRPSHPSACAPPNSCSTFPAYDCPSAFTPSHQVQDPSSSTNHHGASRPSENYFSPASPQIHPSAPNWPLHPTMRSGARYPSWTLQLLDAAQPSSLDYQPEQSTQQNSFLGPQSMHVPRPPPLQYTLGPNYFHPSSGPMTNARYPDPTIYHHHQPRAPSIHEEQSLVTAHAPEDPDHLDYLVRRLTLSAASTRQGPTRYANEPSFSPHSPTPQSAGRTSGHHTATHLQAFVDHNRTRHLTVISTADDNLSPPYAHHFRPHPIVPPSLYYRPIDPPPRFIPAYQPDHSTFQDYSFTEQSTPPVTHLESSLVGSLLVSQPRYAPQSSITIHEPRYSTNRVHQPSLQTPQNQISPSSRRQEQSHQPRPQNQGMFSGSRNLSFKDTTFIDNSTTSDYFMKEFLQHTIVGAEYDSSDRNPPPRCHPGTRLAVLGRCKAFIVKCHGKGKMRWVVGAAGVGKSAIMQMVAEETPADASVFLSVNGRQDGTKTFTTIAYQLAAKYEPYRQFVRNEITRDPSLLRKVLPVQFNKFIVEPFINRNLFNPSRRSTITIDGLDECDNALTQRQLLELISAFCISYPTSPIVWFVASRPEPHITSFFDDSRVASAYTKEELTVDSDEACDDVQLYLRAELAKIKLAYPVLRRKREWPSELEFTKIATAAGGLFAYASTVVRYINDPNYGDPASQLGDVLIATDAGLKDSRSRTNNPLALLDALYNRIISNIPDSVWVNTRKILLACSQATPWRWNGFRFQCNRLGLTEDEAYGAIRHLHAVVKVPNPDKADEEPLEYFHKSFEDFLFDPKRSKLFRNVEYEFGLLSVQSSLRIVEQVPINFDEIFRNGRIDCNGFCCLNADLGSCANISLPWPGDDRYLTPDYQTKCLLYTHSMIDICSGFRVNNNLFLNIFCFNALTTRFTALRGDFPIDVVRRYAFVGIPRLYLDYNAETACQDKLRSELMIAGKLKQVPLQAVDYAAICGTIDIRFTGLVGMDVEYSDPWNPTCEHQRSIKRDEQDRICWRTEIERPREDLQHGVAHPDIPRFYANAVNDSHRYFVLFRSLLECLHCSQRFARLLIGKPDQLATFFVDATELCYVEWSFVDPGDGVSQWRYQFCHSGALKFVD